MDCRPIVKLLFTWGCACSILLIVECQFGLIPPAASMEWRLTGGRVPYEGRLEVRGLPGQPPDRWHTICSDDDIITPLICNDLGWTFSIPCSHTITPMDVDLPVGDLGTIQTLITFCPPDGIQSLSECFVQFENASDTCSHHNDTWIRCTDTTEFEVQLVEGLVAGEGYVQTRCPSSNWTTVCPDDWDPRDANVVCKELGFAYSYGIRPEGFSMRSVDLGDVIVDDVYCTGEEEALSECRLENEDFACANIGIAAAQCAEDFEVGGKSVPLCGRHRCGHPSSADLYNDPVDFCKCDCLCAVFEDCCIDFDISTNCAAVSPQERLAINGVPMEYYKCVELPVNVAEDNYGLVVVAKCPESWSDINTRLNCEIQRNLTDIVGLLPVYDANNASYKNICCAMCHGLDPNDVTFWKVEARYVDTPFGSAINDPILGINVTNAGFDRYVVQWPNEAVQPRSCPINFVDTCASELSDPQSVAACKSYFAPVFVRSTSKRYRKPHCALCNGVEKINEPNDNYCNQCNDLRCDSEAPDLPCFPQVCTVSSFLTVEALFNFNDFQSNNLNDGASCPDNTVYDPFLNLCRSLSCPPTFELVDDRCQSLDPPVPQSSETVVNGTAAALEAFTCILESFGFRDATETGSIQAISSEVRQEIRTCLTDDICEIAFASTFNLELLFQTEMDLLSFIDAVDESFYNTLDLSPVCNVSSIATYISYPGKLAIPSACNQLVMNLGQIFDSIEESYSVVAYSNHKFNVTSLEYSPTTAYPSCLINTNLNCTLSVTLTPDDFNMSSEDGSVHLLSSNRTLQKEDYLLFTDGTIQVCSFATKPSVQSRRSALDITAAVCNCLSVIALIATLVKYLTFGALRNLAGKLVINLVVALGLAYLGLLLAGVFLFSVAACAAWAIVTHFFWIAAFTWMMLFAFNISRTFSHRGGPRSSGSLWKYMLLGWTIPAVFIAIFIGLHLCECTSIYFHYGSVEDNICFLRGPKAVLYAFVIPISILLVFSISFFVSMAVHFQRQRRDSKLARTGGTIEEITYEAAIYLRLSVVIGATWIFAYLYILIPNSIFVSVIYIILNSLQGVFIFLAFGFTSRVRSMWMNRFQEILSSTKTTGASSKSGAHSKPTQDYGKEIVSMESVGVGGTKHEIDGSTNDAVGMDDMNR